MRDEDFHEYRNTRNFTKFVMKTGTDWRRIASSLLRKFGSVPPSIDVDDVVQTMLLACSRFTFEWEPNRGPTLLSHVQWRAIDKALKMVHTELRTGRARPGAPRTGSPRYELCFSSLLAEGEDDASSSARLSSASPATQDRELSKRDALKDPLVGLFAEVRDADSAAKFVLQSQALREKYGITTALTARREVMAAVSRRIEEAVL